jgi:tetratricopeptide (TPR) repeat protein
MKKFLFSLAFVGLSLSTFAQKKFITDAALYMRKYNPMAGVEAAKKNVDKAKEFIDQAAVNPETMNDYKMYLYQGQVYFALTEIAMMEKMNGVNVDEAKIEEYALTAENAFKKVKEDPKKYYVQDVADFFSPRLTFALSQGDAATQKYQKESEAINSDTKLSAQEKKQKIDDLRIKEYTNATTFYTIGLGYKKIMSEQDQNLEYLVSQYLSATTGELLDRKEIDKAMDLGQAVYSVIPKNVNVLISLINIYLQKNDITASEKYLNEALAIDPSNKQLYYVLGTAYMDLNEHVKAEQALIKALEIDPAYGEAQYQLGAHYVNWAKDIQSQMDKLDMKTPQYKDLDKLFTEKYNKALTHLEPWIAANPTECSVYNVISGIYYRLKNDEKDAEYQAKYKACKK